MIRRLFLWLALVALPTSAFAQGFVQLLDIPITTAVTGRVGSVYMTGRQPLDSWRYLAAQGTFTYSYGGTNATAYVQTSLDGGTTWVDVISMQFTTSTATKVTSVHGVPATPIGVVTPTDGSLTANTVLNGIIGDRLRVKLTTTGTYQSTPATNTIDYVDATDATATKVVEVNGVTYTFVAVVAAAGDVKVAGTADATWTNLSRCINKSGGTEGAGQDYMSAGGVAHPTVSSAINTTSDQITLTARTGGTAGNAYTLTSDEATATLGGALFSGGLADETRLKITLVPR